MIFFCLMIFFTFTNSVDPDEMQHHATFHLGLQITVCKSTCLRVSRIQKVNGASASIILPTIVFFYISLFLIQAPTNPFSSVHVTK